MSAVRNGLLVIASVLVALGLIEAALRLGVGDFAASRAAGAGRADAVRYRDLGGGLFNMAPERDRRFATACTETRGIDINAQGFRDAEWSPKGTDFRVAVMGDSFVSALNVGARETVAAGLRSLLGVEVLNAGVSGYSTVTEIAAYRRLVRPFRPDLVVLFFFLGNDVKGNSCRLDGDRALCGRAVDGRAAYPAPPSPSPRTTGAPAEAPGSADPVADLKDFLRRHLALYQLLHVGRVAATGAVNQWLGRVPERWQVYLDRPIPAWQEAWLVTADALRTLRDEAARDGAALALVAIPEHFVTSPEWRRELIVGAGSGVPADFNPALPSRRLAGIAKALGLPFLDPLPAMTAYRDRHGLGYPYFSFRCDGHWNPLGHHLAAREVALFLADRGLVPAAPERRAALAAEREAAFAGGPERILGAAAFAAIFAGGTYRSAD